MPIHDVRHLNLSHRGEPIIEFDPENRDGQHVVTLFRGFLENVWHKNDLPHEVCEALYREAGIGYCDGGPDCRCFCPDCGEYLERCECD